MPQPTLGPLAIHPPHPRQVVEATHHEPVCDEDVEEVIANEEDDIATRSSLTYAEAAAHDWASISTAGWDRELKLKDGLRTPSPSLASPLSKHFRPGLEMDAASGVAVELDAWPQYPVEKPCSIAEESEAGEPPARKVTISDFVRFASRADSAINIIGLLSACAAGASQPLMTIVFGNLTTSFLAYENARATGNADTIASTHAALHRHTRDDLLNLVYLGAATLVLTYIYMCAWLHTGDAITRRICEAYLSSLLRQDVSYFDLVGAGEVTNRLQTDMHLIQEGISDKIPISVMLISTFVSGLIVAFIRSWKLTLALMSVIPCIVVTGFLMNAVISKLQIVELKLVSDAANVALEALSSIRIVKAFGIERCLSVRYDDLNRKTTYLADRRSRVTALGMGILFFILYAAYALAFTLGAKLVANGQVHAGSIISVVLSMLVGTFSLALMAPNLQAMGYCASAAAKVFATIDETPTHAKDEAAMLRPEHCEGTIALNDVTFRYAQRKDVPILETCSLSFASGTFSALVGPSGSGKSTILSLIERFYEPESGSIEVDGIPFREVPRTWLRTQIGLVLQEPTLFLATVRSNIEYGLLHSEYEHVDADTRNQMVEAAAKVANAHDFIMRLPHGYDTMVGDRGLLLSGGQRQRIAIARAIVKQPRILLLDEATSALDAQSERDVQKALAAATQGRTTIAVAHRLATIKEADNIIVLGQCGAVVEAGTHEALIGADGAYAELVRKQQVKREEGRSIAFIDQRPSYDRRDSQRQSRSRMRPSFAHEQRQRPVSQFLQDLFSMTSACAPSSWEPSFVPDISAVPVAPRPTFAIEERKSFQDHIQSMAPMDEGSLDEERSSTEMGASEAAAAQSASRTRRIPFVYLLYRLAQLNKDSVWSLYVPGLLGAAAFGCVYPCFAILLGRTLQTFSQCSQPSGTDCPQPANAHMRKDSRRDALWFFILSILAGLAMFAQALGLIGNSARLQEKLRRISLEKMLGTSIAFFDVPDHTAGVLASSLASNATRINGLLGLTMGSILQAISTLVCGAIVALVFGWKLALVVIACIPLTLSAGFVRLQLIVRKDGKLRAAHAQAAQRACEAIVGIRTVASLTMEDACLAMYREDLQAPSLWVKRAALYGNVLYAFSQSASIWVTALAFWYGSRLLAEGTYTAQQFYTVFLAVVFGSLQAGNAFNYAPDISAAKQAGQEVIAFLDEVQPEQQPAAAGEEPHRCCQCVARAARETPRQPPRLTFQNVHFRYPGEPSSRILSGVSFDVAPGTTCALVGQSGCGKSTCLQLLERFYDATKGRILVDGKDVTQMDLRALRSTMALVSQEPNLFDGTIGFNIACGLLTAGAGAGEDENSSLASDSSTAQYPRAVQERMRRAASEANILDFIEGLPEAFDTHIGAAGTQLSGGQRQRLSLARALIRDPSVLLLDEATSALDSESEAIVQAALQRAAQGRTTISIAHRLASIVASDQIVLLEGGRVKEKGTHEELLRQRGSYAELAALQS